MFFLSLVVGSFITVLTTQLPHNLYQDLYVFFVVSFCHIKNKETENKQSSYRFSKQTLLVMSDVMIDRIFICGVLTNHKRFYAKKAPTVFFVPKPFFVGLKQGLAVGVGFEPTKDLRPCQFSRLVRSTELRHPTDTLFSHGD